VRSLLASTQARNENGEESVDPAIARETGTLTFSRANDETSGPRGRRVGKLIWEDDGGKESSGE
jgi:hypothetical protein